MATLVLTAVGTAIGGPIGGAIGAFVGQKVDQSIVGGGSREGPRISDLAITTSSYGQPVPRHFGKVRAPGTVIWSTDLQEAKETNGNGKGKPKTTTYSYSISFAVAMSSRPISGIGRIWADGNLLRGANGDLKVAGDCRIYEGYGDQEPDPLIAADIGAACPGFRECAYVVFEDLQLSDFGNRIPSLSFEVLADTSKMFGLRDVARFSEPTDETLPQIAGFSDNGGPVRNAVSTIDRVFPVVCSTAPNGLLLSLAKQAQESAEPLMLSNRLSNLQDEGNGSGKLSERKRVSASAPKPTALRYFDIDRDYQTSVQRTNGVASSGQELMLELPASLNSTDALDACNRQSLASRWQRERINWEVAELDPAIGPGTRVKLPGHAGVWVVEEWEWMDRGVSLELEREAPAISLSQSAFPGTPNLPIDSPLSSSLLTIFELPWDGVGSPNDRHIYAAANGLGSNWRGAALYRDQNGSLIPINESVRLSASIGTLTKPLGPSPSLHLEQDAECEIDFANPAAQLTSTTTDGLASGLNRILIGNEVVQFLCAEPVNDTVWRISGLLRGRGGTEGFAFAQQPVGTPAVLLDDAVLGLSSAELPNLGLVQLAAIGLGDDNPVYAETEVSGVSRKPLCPVHPRIDTDAYGNWNVCWTRRARGQWRWDDGFDLPLIEEQERYLIGCGPVDAPLVSWGASTTNFQITSSQTAALISEHAGQDLWVKQVGAFGNSPATKIATI